MSASPASDSNIQIGGSKAVSHGGRMGHWQHVEPDDLERVPFDVDIPAAETLSPAADQAMIDASLAAASIPTDPIPAVQTPAVQTPAAQPTALDASATITQAEPAQSTTEKPKLELQRRQQLEHHLKSNPTDLNAFLELAKIYRVENRPVDARRVLTQAMQIFPDEKELVWELEEATLSRSLQQLREVTDLANRLKTAETERELHRCQHDWANRRIEVCKARLGRDPSMMHLRVSLGEALYDAGEYQEAMEELEPCLDSDEFSPSAHLLRGKCQLALGKDLDAMVSLRAIALRRTVVAAPRLRVIALRLLCETADRLGITLTLANYRAHLQQAEHELAKKPQRASS